MPLLSFIIQFDYNNNNTNVYMRDISNALIQYMEYNINHMNIFDFNLLLLLLYNNDTTSYNKPTITTTTKTVATSKTATIKTKSTNHHDHSNKTKKSTQERSADEKSMIHNYLKNIDYFN